MQTKAKQDPTLPQGFSTTFRNRFWDKVNKNGPIPKHMPHLGNCWLWTAGARGRRGNMYGSIRMGGEYGKIAAHRASWILHNGVIQNGFDCCHTCDNGICVRPSHLWLGTAKDNVSDCIKKGRGNRPTGVNHGMVKLTPDEVRKIRSAYSYGKGVKLAKQYGVCNATISHIVLGQHWKHI